MAQVWSGVHTAQGTPVAVKVLTAEHMRSESQVEALHAEVRAVAGLDHPSIIWVHDAGVVDGAAARASRGALPKASPWLAMDLARGGTLADRMPAGTWSWARAVLLDLLDALAHAHSRGVLHRDLKPENVLFRSAREPAVVLSDFGMAFGLDDRTAAIHGGTPSWCAPEQILGKLGLLGPWTDLYGLGCLAWALVCGRRPFVGSSSTEVLYAHLEAPIPPLAPIIEVPAGLEAWVHGLMQKSPGARCQRAADAAHALRQLPARSGDRRVAAPWGQTVRPTLGIADEETPTERFDGVSGSIPAEEERALDRAPVPETWRGPDVPRPTLRLIGAGLGLYGLRDIAVVGRETEKDALWEKLRAVRATERPCVVALRGPSGFGKSTLARWLVRRADEVGAAEVFRATHNPNDGPMDGIAGMVARSHRTLGIPDEALLAHLRGAVGSVADDPEWEASALLQLIRPRDRDQPPPAGGVRVGFTAPAERYALALRVLERQRRGRVALVWLDDVQWGADALGFVGFALEQPDAGPILFALTAREEALVEEPEADARLAALEDTVLTIGPLDPDAGRRLVEHLLPLAPTVAREVHERTAGNALFAVQLVGDWVERGLLIATEDGFALPDWARPPLPSALGEVWTTRIDALLADRPRDWRDALELAAVLGQDVDGLEWQAACRAAGIRAPSGMVALLLGRRLAVLDPDSAGTRWSFVHGMLREAIADVGRRAGRAPAWHRACAVALQSAGVEHAARRATHFELAGDAMAAVQEWHGALQHAFDHDNALLNRATAAILRLLETHAPDDPRWSEAAFYRTHRRAQTTASEIDAVVHAMERRAAQLGEPEACAAVALVRSQAAQDAGALALAVEHARAGLAYAADLGAFWTTWTRNQLALSLGFAGHFDEAAGVLRSDDGTWPTHYNLTTLSFLLTQAGRWEEADEVRAVLHVQAAEHGTQRARVAALYADAFSAAMRRDWQGALAAQREVERLGRRVGSWGPQEAWNLVQLELLCGHTERAKRSLERLRAQPLSPRLQWDCDALAFVIAARTGAWEELDGVDLTAPLSLDAELVELLEEAGDLAAAAGQVERAARAWAGALAQLEGLGVDDARATRLRDKLDPRYARGPREGDRP